MKKGSVQRGEKTGEKAEGRAGGGRKRKRAKSGVFLREERGVGLQKGRERVRRGAKEKAKHPGRACQSQNLFGDPLMKTPSSIIEACGVAKIQVLSVNALQRFCCVCRGILTLFKERCAHGRGMGGHLRRVLRWHGIVATCVLARAPLGLLPAGASG